MNNNLQLNNMVARSGSIAKKNGNKAYPANIAHSVNSIDKMIKRGDEDDSYRLKVLQYFDETDWDILRSSLVAAACFLLAYSE